MIFRAATRLLIPAATVVIERNELNCKPSELPIYCENKPKDEVKSHPKQGVIEQEIGKVRRKVMLLTKQVDDTWDAVTAWYNHGYEQVQWLVTYLGDEDNTTPKAGAIAIGGLTGYILALRGGFFRKIVFTSAGALSLAAVCYPKQAAEYSTFTHNEIKRYMHIGYNFYHGVKKDDPPYEFTLPTIPLSFSEVWDAIKGSRAKTNDKAAADSTVDKSKEKQVSDQVPLQKNEQ